MDKNSQPQTKSDSRPAPAPEAPATPWPGAFAAYKPSREAVVRNLNAILLLWAASIVGGVILGYLKHVLALQQLLSLLLSAYLGSAMVFTVLAGVRGKTVEVKDAIPVANQMWLKLFVLEILVGVSVAVAFVLLIIPGLFVLPRLSLASYYLVDQDLGIIDAYKASWNGTRGHAGKVWGIIGVSVLMVLPVFTIIGIIATIYLLFMYQAALAVLYIYLHKK